MNWILGISGRRGAGKDTLYQNLRGLLRVPVQRIALADAMKGMLLHRFPNAERAKMYGSDAEKAEQLPGARPGVTYRKALQLLGATYVEMDELYWLREAKRKIDERASFLLPTLFCITDVRFPHEVEEIQRWGGKVVRLPRTPHPEDTHKSETALDGYTGFDVELPDVHSAGLAAIIMAGTIPYLFPDFSRLHLVES